MPKGSKKLTKKEIEIHIRYSFVTEKDVSMRYFYDFNWMNKKIIESNTTEKMKKLFLLDLAEKGYTCGDNYHAYRTNDGDSWHYGYSNDSEVRHGAGKDYLIPDSCLNFLMEGRKKYRINYRVREN